MVRSLHIASNGDAVWVSEDPVPDVYSPEDADELAADVDALTSGSEPSAPPAEVPPVEPS